MTLVDLHTHTLASDGSDRPDELIATAAAAGTGGVEVWHSQHDPGLRRSLQALVGRHGLLATVLV